MDPPLKPDESDCCNSGCNPCILDIYEEQLKKYNKRKTNDELKSFKNCILTTAYTVFKVTNIENHSHDALLVTFQFVQFLKSIKTETSNLKIIYIPGQYFMLKANSKNEEFQRSYTPLSINISNELQFTILVKLYEKGQMTSFIKKLKIDSETVWRGPYGIVVNFTNKYALFIAQGVGVAPIYSMITNLLKHDNCETFLKLYFCCKSCDTIYLRNYLFDLQSHWNFTYEVFLSNMNKIKKYNETINLSKLDYDVLKEYLSDKFEDIQVIICGSNTFMSCFKEIVSLCKVDEQNIILL